ncbi:MAG: nicotinate (nicotinamide) nucleotide adenylyltransferase [Kiritimatiellae bacterium]|nr:nicotinate (nicotinamide) nucleotide adenylyltransferase [Kiritimatiellia bacterium]
MPPSGPADASPAPASAARRRRVGLFGGTFNPVHEGHLAIARDALALFALDEVWLLPASVPPLKPSTNLAPDADRLAMLRLALAEAAEPRLRVCPIEYELPPPSYTYRTILALRERHPDLDLAFVVGADSLLTLHLWYRILDLLELVPVLPLARPGFAPAAADIQLPPPWPDRLLASLRTATLSPASSTDIRAALAATGTSPHLAPSVLAYIRAHQLYSSDPLR